MFGFRQVPLQADQKNGHAHSLQPPVLGYITQCLCHIRCLDMLDLEFSPIMPYPASTRRLVVDICTCVKDAHPPCTVDVSSMPWLPVSDPIVGDSSL